jgi:hypothetical protein
LHRESDARGKRDLKGVEYTRRVSCFSKQRATGPWGGSVGESNPVEEEKLAINRGNGFTVDIRTETLNIAVGPFSSKPLMSHHANTAVGCGAGVVVKLVFTFH